MSILISVQQGTITISPGNTSNTATISAVDTSKAFARLLGSTVDADLPSDSFKVRIALTSTTVVTASRAGTSGSMVVEYVVTEFS